MQRLSLKNLDLISSVNCKACIKDKQEQDQITGETPDVDTNSIQYKIMQLQKARAEKHTCILKMIDPSVVNKTQSIKDQQNT
tara:strand:+ start:742 stop:987 length:246 start_codon:yes stop_codon:yes gene_type:complete